jgi:hypothetical protein
MATNMRNLTLMAALMASGVLEGVLQRHLPATKEKACRTPADINDRRAKNAAKRERRAARARK